MNSRLSAWLAALAILAYLCLSAVPAQAQVTPVTRGGTGTGQRPTVGQVLIAQPDGTYAPRATSSLGIIGGGGFSTSSADSWLTSKTTSVIAEGANLYYTLARVQAAFLGGYNALFGSVTATSATSTNLAVTGSFNFLGTAITNVATWFSGLFDTSFAAKLLTNLTFGGNLTVNGTSTLATTTTSSMNGTIMVGSGSSFPGTQAGIQAGLNACAAQNGACGRVELNNVSTTITNQITIPASNMSIVGIGSTTLTVFGTGFSDAQGAFAISSKGNISISGITFILGGSLGAITARNSIGNITLRDNVVTGTSTNVSFQGAFTIYNTNPNATTTNILIDHNSFTNLGTTSMTTTGLGMIYFKLPGGNVQGTQISNNYFFNDFGTQIKIDEQGYMLDTLIEGNVDVDPISGTQYYNNAIFYWGGISYPYRIQNTTIINNTYNESKPENIPIAGGEEGFVAIFQARNTTITGNTMTGAWNPALNIKPPGGGAIQPGRVLYPDVGLTITGNTIQNFDAWWDPDSMRDVVVSGNTIRDTGMNINPGYNDIQNMVISNNVFYNSPTPREAPYFVLLNNSRGYRQVSIIDNTVQYPSATTSTIYVLNEQGNGDFRDVIIKGNRFSAASSTVSSILRGGSERDPLIIQDNEITDASSSNLNNFGGDADGGIYFQGASTTASGLVTHGLRFMDALNLFWDNLNKRLGIGTTTPSEALSVVGRGFFTGGIRFGDGTIQTTAASSTITSALPPLSIGGGALSISTTSLFQGTTGQIPYFSGPNALSGTSSIFLSPAGRLAIGNTNPQQLLHISSISNNPALLIESAGDGPRIQLKGSAGTSQVIGSNNGATIDINPVNGFSPTYRFENSQLGIYGLSASSATTTQQTPYLNFISRYWNGTASADYSANLKYILENSTPASRFGFSINNTEYMSLKSSGFLGLSTTSPSAMLSLGGGNLLIGAATVGGTPGDLLLPKLASSGGSFLAVDATGKVIATTTPVGGGGGITSVSATYPVLSSGGTTPTISLAFGTTTSNTWAGTQTFTNAPILGTLTGFLKAASGVLSSALVNLASDVSGVLAVANGGTGLTSVSVGSILFGNGTGALATSSGFFWDNGNSRLGIGTSTPGFNLDVIGNEQNTSSSSNALVVGANGATNPAFNIDASTPLSANGLNLKSSASGNGVTLSVTSPATSDDLTIQSKLAGTLTLQTPNSGTVVLKSTNGAQLQITSTAAQFSHAASSLATAVRFRYQNAADTALTASTEAPEIYYNLGNSVRQHAVGNIALQRDFRITGTTHSFATGGGTIAQAAALAIDGPSSGGTNATLTNSSGLLIGTTSPTTLANVTNGFGLSIYAPTGATNNYAASTTGRWIMNGLTNDTADSKTLCLTSTNEIVANAGTGCITSSERFKHDISPLTEDAGVAEILKLNPVQFTYNKGVGDEGVNVGFIAEQVEKIDRRLVVFGGDGTPFSVKYEEITANLALAVQQIVHRQDNQQAEIDELKAQVAALQSQGLGQRYACLMH